MAIRRPLLATVAVLTLGISTWPLIRRVARRSLSRFGRLLLRIRARPFPVDQDNVALVFAPHQDDETLGCGGLMILKRFEGLTVRVAYITDGSGSHPRHPSVGPAEIAKLRRDEARAAMGILGVERAGLTFLDERDGTLDRLPAAASQELVEKIAALVKIVRPDDVFLPCRSDGSSEHNATFVLVSRALAMAGMNPRVLEFPVWSWWNPLLLLKPLLGSRRVWRLDFSGYETLKREALSAYRSQIRPLPPWTRAVLSREFVSFFSGSEEFFFET